MEIVRFSRAKLRQVSMDTDLGVAEVTRPCQRGWRPMMIFS